MIEKITAFFRSLEQQDEAQAQQHLSLELACTVLLCEVMRADGNLCAEEEIVLVHLVQAEFALSSQDAISLIDEAKVLCDDATDFQKFTSIINKSYDAQERTKIVALLWQLANADGHIDAVEEHTIRRIADLLYLRHSEYISAKSSVINKP